LRSPTTRAGVSARRSSRAAVFAFNRGRGAGCGWRGALPRRKSPYPPDSSIDRQGLFAPAMPASAGRGLMDPAPYLNSRYDEDTGSLDFEDYSLLKGGV